MGACPNFLRTKQLTVGMVWAGMSQLSLVHVPKVRIGSIINLFLSVLGQVNISPWLQAVSEDLRRVSQKEGIIFVQCHSD